MSYLYIHTCLNKEMIESQVYNLHRLSPQFPQNHITYFSSVSWENRIIGMGGLDGY